MMLRFYGMQQNENLDKIIRSANYASKYKNIEL